MAHRGLCVFILSILDTGLNSLTLMLGRACPPGRRPGPADSAARASHAVTSTGAPTGAWSTEGARQHPCLQHPVRPGPSAEADAARRLRAGW